MDATFYTPAELAERIKVKEATVRSWAREGKIRAIRYGKSWRIPQAEFDRIIREGVHDSPDEETDQADEPVGHSVAPQTSLRQHIVAKLSPKTAV